MPINPTPEELHDWRLANATPRPLPPSPWPDRIIGALVGALITGFAIFVFIAAVSSASARPLECQDAGAEIVACVEASQ